MLHVRKKVAGSNMTLCEKPGDSAAIEVESVHANMSKQRPKPFTQHLKHGDAVSFGKKNRQL
eukprot:1109404-Pleurochrysis_carterae.AAC.4